jgi:hypothetical protein
MIGKLAKVEEQQRQSFDERATQFNDVMARIKDLKS